MPGNRIYLDYNASAPLRIEARAALLAALDLPGNASSVHAEGRRARAVIETAREAVATLVNARPADVVFTGGASEANSTVLAAGWDEIYLSELEHDSVRASAERSRAQVIIIPPDRQGQFSCEAFIAALAKRDGAARNRALVCLQLANNELGVLQPVAAVAAIARSHGLATHCDAVQAPGRVVVDCTALGVDYLTVSAHKLGGPKGVGALVCVDGAALPALIAGGGQERGRRAGTENIAAIAGFGAAARSALQDLSEIGRQEALRDRLEAGVMEATPHAIVLCQGSPRLANTSCVVLPGTAAETTVIRLDLAGVAISAGAACSSGKIGRSATLTAMGYDDERIRAAVRISVGYATTTEDVAVFLLAWKRHVTANQRAA